MNSKIHQLLLPLLGGFLFIQLFFDEVMGINTLLFTLFIIGSAWVIYPEIIGRKTVRIALASHLFTAIMVVAYGSIMAKVMYMISFAVLAGFMHQAALMHVLSAGVTAIQAWFKFPRLFIYTIVLHLPDIKALAFHKWWYWMRITVVPLVCLAVFMWIYSAANPVFASGLAYVTEDALRGFIWILESLSFSKIFFFCLGTWIVGWVLLKSQLGMLLDIEIQNPENIIRKRGNNRRDIPTMQRQFYPVFPMNALKNEFRSAATLLIMVNVLLLVVNAIDIIWIWVGFEYKAGMDLSLFVHEGTWLLIASIFLSMGILIYYFRKNLNFIKENPRLKLLAKAWIIQNFILAISVGVRNYHYIAHFGLAYKRLGVIVFLILTIAGLYSMYYKIEHRKSFAYLLRVNGWNTFLILICCTAINWDTMIANYNLKYSPVLDRGFLLRELSDKTAPILHQHKDKMVYNLDDPSLNERYNNMLADKIDNLKSDVGNRSWLSWNFADWQAYQYFTENDK
ncbi:DUF4173 domain-containing protein [Limibacter armeniacum]|uniref:DUF4153 domain-containing protein n=1 Tax=Limibacter armeniacum TaxID=466084 RepID=UPI002FE6625F